MPKKKMIETEELIRLLNEYMIENPGIKVKIPVFGKYIRNRGYEYVKDYTLRRDEKFREYIESINNNSDENIYNEMIAYKSIDIDAFLIKNNTEKKLREAIKNIDIIIANTCSKAVKVIDEKKKYRKEIESLKKENNNLKKEISILKADNAKEEVKRINAALKEKNNIIKVLREILNSYVYENIANAILKEQGILEYVNSVVDEEVIEKKLIKADKDIDISQYDSIESILGGFDDEKK